jgi:hypothetical protein
MGPGGEIPAHDRLVAGMTVFLGLEVLAKNSQTLWGQNPQHERNFDETESGRFCFGYDPCSPFALHFPDKGDCKNLQGGDLTFPHP